MRVRAVQHRQQRVEARLKHGHHLAVQQVEFRLRQRPEQVPEQPHVRARVVNLLHSLEARLHERHHVGREHRLAGGVLGHRVHQEREELEDQLRLRRRGLGQSAKPVPHEVGRQRVREAPAQRAGLQQQVGKLDHGRELVRLAAAEEVIDSEADDVDEVSRVENRERLGEVRAHLGAFGALEEREAPHAVGDKARRAAELALAETLDGRGSSRAHLHLLALLTEKVGHGPEQRLHADDEGLDQRLGVREALDGLRGGDLAAAVPDDRLVLVDVLLAVLLLTLGTLVIRRLRLVDFVLVVLGASPPAARPTFARGGLLAGVLLLFLRRLGRVLRRSLGRRDDPRRGVVLGPGLVLRSLDRTRLCRLRRFGVFEQRLDLRSDRPELRHRGVEDADEVRPRLLRLRRVVPPAKDALHEVVHQPHARHLDRQRERVVLDVSAEHVHRPSNLRKGQLQAHVVHELGEERVRKRPERVVARAPGADESLLVEKRIQMGVETPPEILRGEDVAGRHEQLLARRHVVGARSK